MVLPLVGFVKKTVNLVDNGSLLVVLGELELYLERVDGSFVRIVGDVF